MNPFHQILEEYQKIVSTIETLDVTERYEFLHVKARITLIDGSALHVSEVWIADELEKYSYYWLEETGETIIGWDNAPHHEEVETFPHHRHEDGEVKPSDPVNSERVLEILKERIL